MESIIRAPAAGTILTRAVNPGDPVVPLTSFSAFNRPAGRDLMT